MKDDQECNWKGNHLFPIIQNVFSEDDFLPSSVTDQPIPANNTSQSTSQCDNLPTVTEF